MSWLSTYLRERRQRYIEDDERFHRHLMEAARATPGPSYDLNEVLASFRAAIVALQAEQRHLRAQIEELTYRVDAIEDRYRED